MAEKNDDSEMPPIPFQETGNDVQGAPEVQAAMQNGPHQESGTTGADDDDLENRDEIDGGGVKRNRPSEVDDENDYTKELERLHAEGDYIWKIICEFVNHLSDEEISSVEQEYRSCVNSIIEAYKRKAIEVKTLRTYKNSSTEKNHKKNEKIRELKHIIAQLNQKLASSVCAEKKLEEQLKTLTMQGGQTESLENRDEIDDEIDGGGVKRKCPSEMDDKNDHGEVTDLQDLLSVADIRCHYAPCGFVALLRLFNKKGIYFCPTKFLLKIGTTNRGIPFYFSCKKILHTLRDLHFLTIKYECKQIAKGGHNEVLKIVGTELKNSGEEVGLLLYSTKSYNHCVTVYLDESTTNDEPQLKICDAHLKRKDIKDLEEVRSLQLLILKYDGNEDVPFIVKIWGDECSLLRCKDELDAISYLGHQPE